ncbi:hypothetical protein ACJJTC_001520 [Scirpophaga incertulas]
MWRDWAIVLLLMVLPLVPALLRESMSVDYSSEEMDSLPMYPKRKSTSKLPKNRFSQSLCDTIDHSIPKAIENGHFILEQEFDLDAEGNSLIPISVSPPNGFIPPLPKLRSSILHVPRMKVPKLRALDKSLNAPKVGNHIFSKYRADEEESSAERMERVKSMVERMLHLVKLLDKVDRYLSDRTRIIIDKLSKTLAD